LVTIPPLTADVGVTALISPNVTTDGGVAAAGPKGVLLQPLTKAKITTSINSDDTAPKNRFLMCIKK
jgi:hypothetical protein